MCADFLNRFKKIIQPNQLYMDVDYISMIDASGDFKRIYDIQVLMNSWSNILITPKGTYPFDSQYGSNLYKKIYEPADQKTVEDIKSETKDVLVAYDNRGQINQVDVLFLTNMKGFSINIYFAYKQDKNNLKVVLNESMYFQILRTS